MIAALSPATDDGVFVCKVGVHSRLAETLGGKLEFLLVEPEEGRAPAARFVITIDHGYTAGAEVLAGSKSPEASGAPGGGVFWVEGSLMDRDTFFGEQYLFFGHPQLYVSQVKSGLWWPRQVELIGALYAAPITAFSAFYLVGALPFMEEYSAGAWALTIGRFLLICAAIVVLACYRKQKQHWLPGIIWVVGVYVLVSTGLAVPGA
ncbi:MAG: hypothetical protein JW990_08045 [Thermoleophilia bacterium]|nr:hypothetical protein [Thermoleophilia bacterium]